MNIFIKICCLLILLFTLVSCSNNEPISQKPNIILILTDDQGYGDVGFTGNPHIHTPHLDSLSDRSATFSRFYVSPVCSPTRAEILTGRYHPRGGVYGTSQGGERLGLTETTIADILQANGYSTSLFGKWHSGTQPPYHPNNRGFDHFYGFTSGHWGNYMNPMLEENGTITQGEGFITDDLTDHTLEYIRQHKDQPFFSLIAYNTPHSPMQVPAMWWEKYETSAIDSFHRYSSQENKDKTRAAYALCENIDWNVGRIIAQLEELNIIDNTIFLFLSDNGPNGRRWNAGLKGIKGSTDEGGVRSPFFIYYPPKIKPIKINELAGAIDLLPTLLDLVGVSFPDSLGLDGQSLVPLFKDENTWTDRVMYSFWNGQISVRNKNHILDHNNVLYNLVEDPSQIHPIQDSLIPAYTALTQDKLLWEEEVVSLLQKTAGQTPYFPVGYEKSQKTHLPARDGEAHGNISRSSRWPNASYFTNWTSENDSITWKCHIMNSDHYKIKIYYTAPPEAKGSIIHLRQGSNVLESVLQNTGDSEHLFPSMDRVPREESYEKDYINQELGTMYLEKGFHSLVLSSPKIYGKRLMDFRLVVIENEI